MSESHNVQQCDIALASLDTTDVVAMEPGQLRKLLLGETVFEPQFADMLSE